MPHAIVSDRQRERARQLRRTMTRAETLLWRYLKAGHLAGLAFRRQAPMGAYIVDFVCHGARIVVEVDGETHDFASRLRHDVVRDAWLASRGYNVLRSTNEDVLRNLEGVLLTIRENAFGGSPPSLSLPRKGEGNPQTATKQASTSSRRRRVKPR